MRGLLNGISHLSAKRIIHRDLKPENIMFRTKDSLEIAICDFGLATHAEEENYLFVRCGTPGFVAPEIINIKDMSLKSETISDVFSAGIIFHYLLLNKSAFEGTRYADILAQNRVCNFNFDKEEYNKLNSDALDLLKKMIEKRPEFRITAD
jgi:serine/threonine protein kinase